MATSWDQNGASGGDSGGDLGRAGAIERPVAQGGEIPGTGGKPAFSLRMARPAPLPVLLAVPHAGRVYGADLTAQMREPDRASLRLEDRLVDQVAEAVARATGAGLLIAHAPRALIDLNRAPDDIDWDMVAGGAPDPPRARLVAGSRARSGLGLGPRRISGLGELWRRPLAREDLERRIAAVHRPYHLALADALERLRDRWGAVLLIDLHSMPPLGPKQGADAAVDFVLGDRFGASCDAGLSAMVLGHFGAARRSIAHNRPYAGGYVLDRHGAPARGIHALQVEVCRTTYLDAALTRPGPGLGAVVNLFAGLVRRLAGELLGRGGMGLAAE